MSKEERAALIEQANELGLEFKGNISTVKLKALVSGDNRVDEEDLPSEVKEGYVVPIPPKPASKMSAQERRLAQRNKIAAARKKAFKTRIVTITNKDIRDAEFATTANLSFENAHFGLGKVVPLDVPVELEEALIDIAKNAMMPIHKDEVKGGKRTGNKLTGRTTKYAISYGEAE